VTPQAAIFPFTLYGVLAKVPLTRNANNYSARNIWDASVRLSIQDLAPSINVLQMLKHIFNSQGYGLQGTAFDDERLTRLYMSYKNADTYVQPWNYGQHAKIKLNGSWASTYNQRAGGGDSTPRQLERGINQGQDVGGVVYGVDLFDATNTKLNITEDSGGNVSYKEVNDATGRAWVNCQVRIPTSGFYKVELNSRLLVYDVYAWRTTDPATGVQHISGHTQNAENDMANNIYEFRLVRDRKSADFGLSNPRIDGTFYRNNQPQNLTFDAENIPKHFPPNAYGGMLNMIDLAQDRNHVLGFGYGRNRDRVGDFENPRDLAGAICQLQAAKPAISWDTTESADNITKLAIKSTGWWKWGRIGNFDNEGDNPNVNIDYSGGTKVVGKVFDANGNPQDPSGRNLGYRYQGYYLSSVTGFLTPAPDWETSDFLDLAQYTGLNFTADIDGETGVAVVAFYDINLQFIGVGVDGSVSEDYTNEPVVAPPDAAFVRLSGPDGGLAIGAGAATDVNIILERFAMSRFFTYVIEAPVGSNYQGYAYVHNGAQTEYLQRFEFVDGRVEIPTGYAPIQSVDPKLSIYLKTADFDVDGTLTISRRIEADSEDVIDWELTNKYNINLQNAPVNSIGRGWSGDGLKSGQGSINAVVWFDAGELISVASVSAEGRYRQNGMHSTFGMVEHYVDFDLSIQPFRTDLDWLKVSLNGDGTGAMNWNDAPNFDTDSINLVGFLSADVKTDDFIDNFCKAFNLRLSQLDAQTFTLDVKQSKTAVSSLSIDLDKIASVRDRSNSDLGLPSLYKLGFTVDQEERGFVVSGDDGGGQFETGATEEKIIEQKSNFSYNWFEAITKKETAGDVVIQIPVISKADVWAPTMPYPEAMRKRYTDLAYRFWYYDGLLNSTGATFAFNGAPLDIARVSNEIPDVSILNYKNQLYTILANFFTVLINGSSHYTEIETYLTPTQYEQLDGSIMAKFNGDLYFVAELTGYDPTGKNKTKIKLIRKI